ncbi:hypothetical protein BT69DRAFT_1217821, partial [Atractiella rhizophila]
ARNLVALYASHNFFNGSIDFSPNPNLTKVDIDDCHFSGQFPPIQGLTQIQTFSAAGNAFTGEVGGLANLTHLTNFDISKNQLSGPLPDPSALLNLQSFAVSSNSFSSFPTSTAPRTLQTCTVDSMLSLLCPPQSVLQDPNSLANRCKLNCAGGGAVGAQAPLSAPGTIHLKRRGLTARMQRRGILESQ